MTESICGVDKCNRVVFARGLCKKHYWKEYGPELTKRSTTKKFVRTMLELGYSREFILAMSFNKEVAYDTLFNDWITEGCR